MKIPRKIPSPPPQPTVREKLGYAHVSTNDQDTALQVEAFRQAGCEWVFSGNTSGDRAMFQTTGALAESERNGRPSNLSPRQRAEIRRLAMSGQKPQAEVARQFSADSATVCRIAHTNTETTTTTKHNEIY